MRDVIPSLISRVSQRRSVVVVTICASLVLFVALVLRWTKLPLSYPPFYSALVSAAPPNATVISISKDLIGPQVTRLIGGTWVGRVPYQYMVLKTAEVRRKNPSLPPDVAERLARYALSDQIMLVDQIREKRPDIVLITTAELKHWAFSQSEIAAVLANYEKAAVVDEVEIWRRK